jgi:UDP-N-acetyl-D-galactosamine dehydrogenase
LETIAVLGLGYVGLPLALAFADVFPAIGFDVDALRIAELKAGRDRTREVSADELRQTSLTLTSDPGALKEATMFIVAVPTPVDANKAPDLTSLRRAAKIVGAAIRRGSVVVIESTVFPGATEEICGPIIEDASGLRHPRDFTLAYSPERANPGDPSHGLRQISRSSPGRTPQPSTASPTPMAGSCRRDSTAPPASGSPRPRR